MKLTRPNCPECNQEVSGILEVVQGSALIDQDQNGEWSYSGETKMFWDTQKPMIETRTRISLLCPDGHEWTSNYKGIL